MTDTFVPFQPNIEPGRHGQRRRRQGRRDPLRRDRRRPGRAAAGHARVPDVQPLLQRARRAVHRRRCTCRRRRARRSRPAPRAERAGGLDGRRGRSRSAGRRRAPATTVTFTVTPSADRRGQHQLQDLGARGPIGAAKGYTDQVVRVVSPVEGRFQRWGNWAEFDSWLENTGAAGAPARPLGRDPDDGRRRDVHAAGRRPQLVRHARRAAR